MAYLLTALTFLGLILFYSFYPRTDTVELLDKPSAKAIAAELISQHSAALQAAIRLIRQADGTNKMAYEDWVNNLIGKDTFERFLTPGLTPPIVPITSIRVCINNADGTMAERCAVRTTETNPDYPMGTTDFIVTYIPRDTINGIDGIDDIYGKYLSGLAVHSLGESVYQTNYTKKQHLTTNCGSLEPGVNTKGDSQMSGWVLSNTLYKTVNIPISLANLLEANKYRYLMCITRVSVAYENITDNLTDFVNIEGE